MSKENDVTEAVNEAVAEEGQNLEEGEQQVEEEANLEGVEAKVTVEEEQAVPEYKVEEEVQEEEEAPWYGQTRYEIADKVLDKIAEKDSQNKISPVQLAALRA